MYQAPTVTPSLPMAYLYKLDLAHVATHMYIYMYILMHVVVDWNPWNQHPKSEPRPCPCLRLHLSRGMWLEGLGFKLCPDAAWARTDRQNSKRHVSWLSRGYCTCTSVAWADFGLKDLNLNFGWVAGKRGWSRWVAGSELTP